MAFPEHQQLQPEDLLRFITQQQEQIMQLKEQIELLEVEIRRLKKLPAKPDIKPNTKPPDDDTDSSDGGPSTPKGDDGASPETSSKQKVKKPNEKTRKLRKQPRKPSVEKSIPIAATDVPQGSIRNGATPFHVQELTIQTSSIEYLLEQWVSVLTACHFKKWQPPSLQENASEILVHQRTSGKLQCKSHVLCYVGTCTDYYDWLSRPESKRSQEVLALKADIKAIHEKSRQTYGERRIKDDLTLFYDESGQTHQPIADKPLNDS